MKGIHFSSET